MSEIVLQEAAQAPARAASRADAELRQLDAQLEIAAKKAALADMQRRAAEGGDAAPAVAAAPGSSTITYEIDGKPVVLENPTAAQLEALTASASREPELQGAEVVSVVSVTMGAIVALTALILWHRRKMRAPQPAATRETETRMARIENAVETIAIEVERISEGQRYASKMLAEGAATRVAVPERADVMLQNRGEG